MELWLVCLGGKNGPELLYTGPKYPSRVPQSGGVFDFSIPPRALGSVILFSLHLYNQSAHIPPPAKILLQSPGSESQAPQLT